METFVEGSAYLIVIYFGEAETLYATSVFLLGEVPTTLNQRMDGKTVYVNKSTRSENSAMDHATKRHLHVIALFTDKYCSFCKFV